ncbi:MAG: phosphodiester glycosidase family protein [Saprospiraceae bacterium]|nr:phosphodiester glycosidase family protein [Saprospiraceae bacterium]
MKKLLFYTFIWFYHLSALAQTKQDKATLIDAAWVRVKLGKGLAWYHFHFVDNQLFQSNQNIHYVKIAPKGQKKYRLSLVSAGDSLVKTSKLAQQAGAIAAINGSFFDVKNGGAVDFIKVNGVILDTSRLDAKGKLTFHQKSGLVIQNNKVSIVRQTDSLDLKWSDKLKYDNVLVTGPLLLWQGDSVPLSKIAFNDNRHPRSCACITEKSELILLTVDGRTAQSQGLNLHELTFLMKTLGCRDAVNFDGGGSTTMYIAEQPSGGVVNMPCDNKLFDHEGERKVSNIFAIQKNKK